MSRDPTTEGCGHPNLPSVVRFQEGDWMICVDCGLRVEAVHEESERRMVGAGDASDR